MALSLKPSFINVAHGSNLDVAIKRYGGHEDDWLDLSSAISPYSWWSDNADKIQFPDSIYRELPSVSNDLNDAIRAYYGCSGLAVAGSQAAIKTLPLCINPCVVWVTKGSYGEHAASWLAAGHQVVELRPEDIRAAFNSMSALPDVLIVVNPDNPSGELYSYEELTGWAHVLRSVHGLLVCDEAFIDATPHVSLLTQTLPDNVVVLRSLGKFFGLAGIRFGVVFANADVLQAIGDRLGPWTISAASMWIAQHALLDQEWQTHQRIRLKALHQRAVTLMASENVLGARLGDTDLFITFKPKDAVAIQQQLAEHRIWSRCFKEQNLLRMGYPLSEAWVRLKKALESFT